VDQPNGNQRGRSKAAQRRIVPLASQEEASAQIVFGDDARQWASTKVEQLRKVTAQSAAS
jgi:hypothetical protein